MKYFTAEILNQYGADDEQSWLKAHDEWEKRSEEYRTYIDSLNLPPNVKKLRDLYLHDAEILELSLIPKDSLYILKLIDDWRRPITIKYKLYNNNCVEFIYHPEDGHGPLMQWWLYDEIIDHGSYYKHSVLISGIAEIGISFTDVEILL